MSGFERPAAVRVSQRNRFSARWLVCVALVLSMIACGASRRDPVIRATRVADVAWRQRAEPDGLEKSLQVYLDLDADYPEEARVYWRLARVYTTMGDDDPSLAVRHYGVARELGLKCLMLEPSFAGLVVSRGGLVVPAAADELTEVSKECLVWTVIAWSRWVRARGAAGVGLDLDAVTALGTQAAALGGSWGFGRGFYAQGLALSLPPPALRPDLEGARAAFEKAIEAAPERLTPQVDLALYVYRPLGEDAKANALLRSVANATLPKNDPEEMEDLHAQARARAALGEAPAAEMDVGPTDQ